MQVVRGVSMHIKPGESVALVGPSGSAKSTILKLVTRLYDAAGGSVKVNGVDVRDLTTDSLRSAVAVVPQDTVLFNDTILQNIRWGVCNSECCGWAHLHVSQAERMQLAASDCNSPPQH